MDGSFAGEVPAILQLCKWVPSKFQLKLSEFREAFISPTREQLLLLSYQCEALLLPLTKDDPVDNMVPEICYVESSEHLCSSASFSQVLTTPSRSDSMDSIPCPSGSVIDFSNGFSLDSKVSKANSYPFISDVNSLAWGVCGDTYNQHEDASFRELLFVSGNHGVTVHAFSSLDETSEKMTTPMPEVEFRQGSWVEWGPSTSARTVEGEDYINLCPDAFGNHGKGDWGDKRLNGFSAQSRLNSQRFNVSETQSYPIRRIFLPSDRFGGDDCICFSPFGITRLNRNCNSKDERSAQIIHLNLPIDMSVTKNSMCDITHVQGRKEVSIGEAVGCSFQGYIYLVTKCGLSVFLPSVSVPSDFLPLEISGHQQPSRNTGIGSQLEMSQLNQPYLCSCSPWQVEILDRVLLFEGPEKADCVCLENGWDLKISRMRRLQMALDYLKFDEINESLDMLVNVELAEEGILRLLFSAIHLLVQKRSSDNEVSVASRLLALATCFATKMIRKYGFVEHKREAYLLERLHGSRMLCLPSILPDKAENEIGNSRRMHEMARFLEIIRNLQRRISAKFKKSSQGDGERALSLVDPGSLQDESHFSIAPADALSLETLNKQEITISASASAFNDTDKFALMPKDYVNTKASGVSDDSTDVADLEPKKVLPLENPKEMVARWKIDKLDLKSVVKDALLSGRLPLAVLQLHLHRSREIIADEEPHDTFTEVRVIGRAIAYDLFLKGEIGLAVTTLEKLGEDIETCLKELFFGTVRRSLRVQITEEMRRYGYLGPNDCKILERLSLIERFYPSSVFWKTFEGRQKLKQVASTLNSIEEINLHLLGSHMFNNLIIKCGEIDGVVLGSWTSTNENSSDPMIEEDNSQAGYWAAAAVWYGAWDQRTIDRSWKVMKRFHVNTIHALHKLVVQHCAQYNLPNLLDLYLDHHKLVLDNDSLCSLEDSAGDCQWAKWLLLSRIKGREYDASFSNARSIMSHSLVLGRNITLPEIDEIICTVDDIAEGGGEMGALATLMYAPAPIQRCISSGSINRHSSSSAQCTLENLRPTLQRFPTLWRKLLAACFGQDTTSNFLGPRVRNAFTDHLNWRDNIFFSAVRDTSLLQMLPCWFPKAVRRLVQLYIQGPLGWQSFSGLPVGESVLHRNIDFSINSDEHAEMNAISWEAIIQRHIEDELYDSSREETGLGLEHHLHRGRALAAFNRLLGLRIEKLKLEDSLMHGQSNVQSDVQILLSPITQSEESLVSFVMPVAITHFEDSVFVASCAFLLELCGLSASMLRVDIAVLRRISSFYQCTQNGDISKQVLGKGSAFHSLHHEGDIVAYLAQALADEYVHQDTVGSFNQKGAPKIIANRRPCRALMLVLLHLEKASLPQLVGGRTCGTWLLSGNGDGAELRNGQKAASQLWSLVTNFCQMHQLPVSTKYLALLARDNDWVGFLSEAQIGGYPFDIVMQVASKEFSDRRLRIHILTVWETSSIKVNDIASQIAENVASAVEASNSLPADCRAVQFRYNRQTPKRRRLMEPVDSLPPLSDSASTSRGGVFTAQSIISTEQRKTEFSEHNSVASDLGDGPASLSKMVAVLCEQHLFLPLLRSFEMFLPSCALLPFIRALQAFTQMRLSEASAHLGSFSARIRDEPTHLHVHVGRESHVGTSWISSIAIKAADAMLSTCPSPYEKRCLLQLLAATDFGDGGSAATYYRRVYWKINLAEPLLRKDDDLHLGNETLDDDASLLTALIKSRQWEQARNWARQLETSGSPWKSIVHHVTETQAESMVAEWKEFLWDVPEERIALWGHCQTLFIRYSFPALQAGLFFLKHADTGEKDLPARELHELLLLSLQWLSGMITQSNPVYPLHLLREIETRVWLLAVESEAQLKSEGDFTSNCFSKDTGNGNSINIIDRAANIITKMDNHITTVRSKTLEKHDGRDISQVHHRNQIFDTSSSTIAGGSTKTKRRAKGYVPPRRAVMDFMEKSIDSEDSLSSLNFKNDLQFHDESVKLEISFSKWEEKIDPAELERAVLSLLEFGQVTAAKQLQHKLSPGPVTPELLLADAALKLAAMSTPSRKLLLSMLDEEFVLSLSRTDTDCVLESFATIMTEGGGRGLCKRIIAVVKAANVLGLSFSEAFDKQPVELLQLLSLKAQESFEEACLLVQTHSMPAASIAQILAESFLKGLLAAHRGGYMDSQKEEGPAPLLWRFSDFLKWAELCPSESEIGHALMRLVITGQEIPHACEVELLILSHHFYRSSACLDGVDVLVALAATRVEAYVAEGDFPCLARLITGVDNFHALNFILGILIENGQLDLLLRKYSAAADTNTSTAEAVRGFRMSVLTSLKHFNPNDLDAFAMVYNHFDMKHETASLLESRAVLASQHWFRRYDRDQNEDLLDSMRYYIEAAEVHSSIDAGNKTCRACAQASLVSLQIRMPDSRWLSLSETNARRALVEQSRFQEALIVAEAYGLNQASEWALVLWNQMLNPELTEEFVAEFVAVLPLQPSMLIELARFYRAENSNRPFLDGIYSLLSG
ncbi:uncharacterized protein LOC110812908 [Carica papaya]|uniref:uncharacterized protein LOC110812908 n=1 Tax=Carica papaya TaxID=3649 RepID=UPI000B8CA7FB|nr:uncharacterized protein LOC110812908 [Carica papaya]